jgi:hypothetical protein
MGWTKTQPAPRNTGEPRSVRDAYDKAAKNEALRRIQAEREREREAEAS